MNFENNWVNSPVAKTLEQENLTPINLPKDKEVANGFGESVHDECLRQFNSGEAVALALKEISQDALTEGLKKRDDLWQESANVVHGMNNFIYLKDASPEDLEKDYLKFFEPQASKFYLSKILTAVNSEAFRLGFFNVYKDREASGLSDKLLNVVAITDKLVEVSKKLSAKPRS